jgi:hypothetical protein
VVVPDVRGKTIPQAIGLLAGRRLCPWPEMPIRPGPSSGRVPIVVDEDRRPGARVARGTYVMFTVRGRDSGTLVMHVDAVSGFDPCPEP